MSKENLQMLHRSAMELADEAMFLRRSLEDGWISLFKKAAELEGAAAEIAAQLKLEPTRTVLYRSAASLAINAQEIKAAEQYALLGLLACEDAVLREELKDVYEQINFHRHLELRGTRLSDGDIQISLSGEGVGFGYARIEDVSSRFNSLKKILVRTHQRLSGLAFSEKGGGRLDVYASVPRASSFATTIRVGTNCELPSMDLGGATLLEAVTCLECLNSEGEESVRERISDDRYFANFIALAKQFVPDGRTVKMVGLTYSGGGVFKAVHLLKSRQALNRANNDEQVGEIQGVLTAAEKSKGKPSITIKMTSGVNKKIFVSVGMIDDIVRPLWGMRVRATVMSRGAAYFLQDIEESI